jgi:hypothetical protein
MDFFSFLSAGKPAYFDKVWKTRPMALKGLVTDALKAITENKVPVILTFFEQSKQEIIQFLETNGVPYSAAEIPSLADKKIFISDTVTFFSRTVNPGKWIFLFAEHYPLPGKEVNVLTRLRVIAPGSEIFFCSSLEDRALALFGGDRLTSIMEKLGLRDDEFIEHALVSKSMLRAREKIAASVKAETPADSEEEWFRKNVRKI